MTDKKEYRDLCVTCNNFQICTSRKDFRRPVLFCEEFDDYVPPASSQETSTPSESPIKSKTEEKDYSLYTGLCVNCAHRESCTYLKPEGGIWHCEEYE